MTCVTDGKKQERDEHRNPCGRANHGVRPSVDPFTRIGSLAPNQSLVPVAPFSGTTASTPRCVAGHSGPRRSPLDTRPLGPRSTVQGRDLHACHVQTTVSCQHCQFQAKHPGCPPIKPPHDPVSRNWAARASRLRQFICVRDV